MDSVINSLFPNQIQFVLYVSLPSQRVGVEKIRLQNTKKNISWLSQCSTTHNNISLELAESFSGWIPKTFQTFLVSILSTAGALVVVAVKRLSTCHPLPSTECDILSRDFSVSRLFSIFWEYQSRSRKFWSRKKVSVLVSKIFGLEKKSQYQSQKYLVSKKSLGISLENFGLKKSLSIGLKNFGLKKKSRYRSRKFWSQKKF